jgi:hypothetical protein
MFNISRPIEIAGSMPSEMDRILDTAAAQQGHRVQHVDQRPAQAVDTPHNNGVAFLGILGEPFHTGPSCAQRDDRSTSLPRSTNHVSVPRMA